MLVSSVVTKRQVGGIITADKEVKSIFLRVIFVIIADIDLVKSEKGGKHDVSARWPREGCPAVVPSNTRSFWFIIIIA